MGEKMEVQEDLLEQLKAIFAGRGGEMPATNIKQATLIPSAEVIPNPMGTAPGWWVDKGGHVIVCTPGPPRELERMWTYEIAPRLRQLNPDVAIVTRTIKTFGISEGGLDEMLTPLFKSENPTLGIYSKQDGIHLRAIATAGTESEAARLIEPMEAEIRSIVGAAAVWGVDDETPESQAAAFLTGRGETLAVMENFTGGLLASTLAEVPESRGFLRGGIVLFGDEQLEEQGVDADLVAEHGAASGPVAEAMARAAQRTFGADYGIGVHRHREPAHAHERPAGDISRRIRAEGRHGLDGGALSNESPTDQGACRHARAAGVPAPRRPGWATRRVHTGGCSGGRSVRRGQARHPHPNLPPARGKGLPPRRRRGQRKILLHGNLDDARPALRKRVSDGLADVRRALHVVALRTVHLGQPVEARVLKVHADVALVVVAHLLRLLGPVAAVVKHDAHQRDVPAHRGVDLAGRVQETAIALDAHRRPVGASQLRSKPHTVAHAEAALVGVVEHGARQFEREPVVGTGPARRPRRW